MNKQFLIFAAMTTLVTLSLMQATPLGDAAARGDLEQVRRLIQSGDDVNERHDNDGAPLHHAARFGHVTIARELLVAGANPDVYSERPGRWTPLHCAAGEGHAEIVRLLLQHGATVDIGGEDDSTPLQIAMHPWQVYPEVARLLLQHGADPTNPRLLLGAAESGNIDIVQMLIHAGVAVNAPGWNGLTPLHYAARKGGVEMVRLLLQNGADVQTQDEQGVTPLHEAIGCPVITRELLQAGAEIDAQTIAGWTPFHYALHCIRSDGRKKFDQVARILLNRSASPRVDLLAAGATDPLGKATHQAYLEQYAHLAQRWTWELQQALLDYKKDTPAKLPEDLVQLICQFTTDVTPKGPEGLFGWFKYYIGW